MLIAATALPRASSLRVRMRTVEDESAARATCESAGAATMTAAPRRTASALLETSSGPAPTEPASTTTRSSGPVQAGSPANGQATTGTGQQGSSRARTRRDSGPTMTTPRGR